MKTAWDHLPNAAHIDRVLAHVKQHPKAWAAARDASRTAAWDVAWDAARDAVRTAARTAAWWAAYDAAGDAVRTAAWDVVTALVAWDRASSYLDLPPDQVRVLALLGDNIAILMLPAVVALETEKELT